MSSVGVVDRAYSALALEVLVPGEVFRLAQVATADDEINVHAPDVREELQRTAPRNLDELVVVLERCGFALRPINGSEAALTSSTSGFGGILARFLSPCAYERLRRNPPAVRVETDPATLGERSATGDDRPDLAEAAGYGIFGPRTALAEVANREELVGPVVTREQRTRHIQALDESFDRQTLNKAERTQLDRALATLSALNSSERDVERAQDLATVTIVRGTAAALEPAQVTLATHKRFLYVHTARLMELADLVTQPDLQSDDPDGARFERVRKAFQRHERGLGTRRG